MIDTVPASNKDDKLQTINKGLKDMLRKELVSDYNILAERYMSKCSLKVITPTVTCTPYRG